MKFSGVAVALLGLASSIPVTALPSPSYVVHELRGGPRRNHWKRSERVNRDAIIPLRIGLTQRNLHLGYDRLMEVSHPSSPNFGKHLTADEAIDLFAPTDNTVAVVREWLIAEGIPEASIVPYENKGWLAINLPVRQAEKLFRTEYHEHDHMGSIRLGCDSYSVPKHLAEHIDYITPGVKLSPPMRKRQASKRTVSTAVRKNSPQKIQHSDAWRWNEKWGSAGLPPDLEACAVNFTATCYRALYEIPPFNLPLPGNSLGLFESGDTYSQEDLDAYFAAYAPYIPQGTSPVHAFIDGAEAPVPPDSEYNTGESDIDMAITMSLVYPQTVTLYQVDDRQEAEMESEGKLNGFLNTFLDALDGSYCNYTAYGITGDSPGIDASYPDSLPGGYKGSRMCGTYKPARVISGSYGESEMDLPKKYTQRQCNEFMKLGLQGHTFLFSSSDYGVASSPGDGSDSGCLSASGQNQTIYNPDYPSNCPYITSVGATQLQPDQTIKDPESAMQTPLGPGAQQFFSSAGGFSNYFPVPEYQKEAVASYFAKHDPGHPYYIANDDASNIGENGGIYNRAGRAYPDISANGANYLMYTNSTLHHWFGTSLAAPLWAAVITLINQERQLIGKGPVGFINPVLYKHTDVLTDIKNGSNPNCGSSGFSAVDGWDPVTGLGTPKYPALLGLYLALP